MTTQTSTQTQAQTTRTRSARITGTISSALILMWGIGMALVSPIGPLYLKPPLHELQHLALGALTLISAAALAVSLRKSRAGLAIGAIGAIVGILFAIFAPSMPLFIAPPNHTTAMLAAGSFTALLGILGLGVSMRRT